MIKWHLIGGDGEETSAVGSCAQCKACDWLVHPCASLPSFRTRSKHFTPACHSLDINLHMRLQSMLIVSGQT